LPVWSSAFNVSIRIRARSLEAIFDDVVLDVDCSIGRSRPGSAPKSLQPDAYAVAISLPGDEYFIGVTRIRKGRNRVSSLRPGVSSLRFEFYRKWQGETTGYDMGDMKVVGDDASSSSDGHRPSQSMMIYLALVGLLDGVARLSGSRSGAFRFVGIDSSFTLDFSLKKGVVTVTRLKVVIAKADVATLLVSLHEAVDRFLAIPSNQLPPTDPVAEDLRAARQGLLTALAAVGL
jgi:hypothetical protein